jgi:hypothetical protein
MIRKITLLVAFMFINVLVFAQYSQVKQTCNNQNPGDLNNNEENPALYSLGWNRLLGGSSVPLWSAVQTIPFTFQFNGNSYTSYKVSTTGILTFSTGVTAVPDSNNVALPSPNIPDNSICVWGITARPGSWNDSIGSKTFGVAPNRQHWVWFCSVSRAGSTGSGYTYWSIVLEESSNKIYIVDQRTAPSGGLTLTLGIQFDSTSAIQVAGSPNLASNVITTNTGNTDATDNVYYEFGENLLDYDVRAKTLTLQSIYPYKDYLTGPFPIAGTITNLGTQNITDLVLNYSVDGGAVVSSPPLMANLLSGRCYNYTHPVQWAPASPGWHNIKVWADSFDGNNDQNPVNDTLYAKVFIYDNKPDIHKVVVEEATGTWCGWCPRGTVYMDSIAHAYPNGVVPIAVHGGSSSEPMRVTTYDAGILPLVPGHPHVLVNRVYADDPSDVFNMYNAHINDFGLADVDVSVSYNSLNRQSVVTATITSAVNIDGDYRLACVYTEDNVTGTGNGSNTVTGDFDQVNYYSVAWNNANGYTPPGPLSGGGHDWAASSNPVPATIMEYDFVARTIQGGFNGQSGSLPSSMSAGGVYTYAFPAYTIPANYNPANMKAHILLIDFEHKAIMNGNSMPLINVGISDPSKGKYDLSVSPNPATNQIYVQINFKESDDVNLIITDLLGKECYSQDMGTVISGEQRVPVDISGLSSGTYFISLVGKNGSATTKFVK